MPKPAPMRQPDALVYGLLSMAVGRFRKERPLTGRDNKRRIEEALPQAVYLSDPSAAADAAELIARFGVHAASEAAARADRSRDLGNVVHFCRWREIERMIALLSSTDPADATLH
jgi:hypothetical protein